MKSNLLLLGLLSLVIFGCKSQPDSAGNLTDEELTTIVKQSYQYVAMYNVNNNLQTARRLGRCNGEGETRNTMKP